MTVLNKRAFQACTAVRAIHRRFTVPVPQVVVFPNFTPLTRVTVTAAIGGKMEPYVNAKAELGRNFDGEVRFTQICAFRVGGLVYVGQLLRIKDDMAIFAATNGVKTARHHVSDILVYGIVDKIVISTADLTS